MYKRKRGVNKCVDHFSIGGKELPWVSTYRYLGCVINDRLDCSNIYGEASGRNGVSGIS